MPSKIKSCRFGDPRKRGEGLRIGTVRYLPRGIKKADLARLDFFDVWFPTLAPSKELIKAYKERVAKEGVPTEPTNPIILWFERRYLKELKDSLDARHAIELLAVISNQTPITIGCYCSDENLCHRSILKREIEKAALLKPYSL
ncbi:MAG: DUF488 family protein [Thermodesulfobacteriota bacterium]